MSTTQPAKLTKKQRKGIAFRDRKQGRSKGKNDPPDGEGISHEVPVEENQDLAEIQGDAMEDETLALKKAGKGKAKATSRSKDDEKPERVGLGRDVKVVETTKKRKREAESQTGADESQTPKQKKKKKGDSGVDTGAKVGEKDGKNQGKQRFILFVGMLSSEFWSKVINCRSQVILSIQRLKRRSKSTSQHVVSSSRS